MTKTARTPHAVLASLFLFACVSSDSSAPQTLVVGDRLEPATLLDQHERPHSIDEGVRVLLFARDMEGGELIRTLLEEKGDAFLEEHRALYVADISGMPTLIANLIAIPKMRDQRSYPTLLDRDGEATAAFPSLEGQATILLLDRLRVEAIEYRGSVAGVEAAVDVR